MRPNGPPARRTFRLLIMLAAVFSIFPGGSPPNAGTPENADVLRLRYWQAPTLLNPHLSTGNKDQEASRLTYEPLASFDAEGRLVPFLAAEIPSLDNGGVAPDGRSATWRLRPGLKWSDGHPVTADDVRFTYRFITDPDIKALSTGGYTAVETVEAVDDLTVKVRFKDRNPSWAVPFVGVWGMILPRHIFGKYGPDEVRSARENQLPVGTGPYRVVEFNKDDLLLIGNDLVNVVRIIYERNPHYRDPGRPRFKQVILKGGGDVRTAARAVLTEGAADFAWNLQADMATLEALASGGKGNLVPVQRSYVERISLNRTDPDRATETGERSSLRFPHPFFSDKRVRQAFAHAVDREAVAALYGKSGRPATNLLVSPSRYASPNTSDLYPYDPARAAALLDAAGWTDSDGDGIRDKDGVDLTVLYQTSVNPVRQKIQKIVKRSLTALGVGVELRYVDASRFFGGEPDNTSNFHHFYADMQQYNIGNRLPDPLVYLSWMTCAQIPDAGNNWSGSNDPRWCNPAYDRLVERAAFELSPEKRRDLFIRMNDLLVEDVVQIALVNAAYIHGVGERLAEPAFTPWDASTWRIADWRLREQ